MKKSLLKKGIVVILLLLFVGAGALPSVMSEEKQKTRSATTMQTIWYVDDDGDNTNGKTWATAWHDIQQGIISASNGETILVGDGIYNENIVVDKELIIKGGQRGPEPSIIDGGGTGDVVNITANAVTIRGFTIQNSGNDYGDAGILLVGNGSIIKYNNITKNFMGIRNAGYIGWYTGFNTLISCNNITDNVNRGIGFYYAENTIITCNKISNSNTVGISGLYFNNGVISCNNISTQIRCRYAILLQTCNDNEISCNSIWAPTASFGYGILLYYNSNRNDVTGNTIQHTDIGIRVDGSSDPNLLYHNTLMDNGINAWDNNLWKNTWDENYWDDLADNPWFPINGTYCIYNLSGIPNAVDNFPLLAPHICPNPPTTPTINGPKKGKPGVEYDYGFVSQDPNCGCLIYIVDWGDGNTSTSDLVKDGTPTTLSHTWSQKGTYIIRAKAKSLCGGESDWGTLTVKMPRNKEINTPFLNFLESHPNMFPMLRLLLQRLGLQ